MPKNMTGSPADAGKHPRQNLIGISARLHFLLFNLDLPTLGKLKSTQPCPATLRARFPDDFYLKTWSFAPDFLFALSVAYMLHSRTWKQNLVVFASMKLKMADGHLRNGSMH
jgi:hypothetical protein